MTKCACGCGNEVPPSKMNANPRKWFPGHEDSRGKAQKAYQERRSDWIRSLKRHNKCAVCGEYNPTVLEFHHIDPKEKKLNLGTAIHRGVHYEDIINEIPKCVVLCSNHHKQVEAGEIDCPSKPAVVFPEPPRIVRQKARGTIRQKNDKEHPARVNQSELAGRPV